MTSHLGILEPRDYHGEVTGTVYMGKHHSVKKNKHRRNSNRRNSRHDTDHPDHEASLEINREISGLDQDTESHDGLKRTNSGIVLNPQPHDDPNDPLNWPIWRRDLALLVIGFHSFICGGMTPLLAAAFTELSAEFNVTQAKLAYLVGPFMLAMGVGSVILAPTAVLYGKRLVYLVGLVIFLAGTLWGGGSHSFNSLLGARIIMGIGAGPTESLPSSSIAEIYFLHERAYRLGTYTLLLLGGKNIVPMIAGFIIGGIGWKWLFWILSIIIGMNFVLTFFFVPETWWDRTAVPTDKRSLEETAMAREQRLISRQASYNKEAMGSNSAQDTSDSSNTSGTVPIIETSDQDVTRPVTIDESLNTTEIPEKDVKESETIFRRNLGYLKNVLSRHPPIPDPNSEKKSYASSLRVYYGKFTKDKWWMVALRPFFLLTYPGILFSTLIYAMSVNWLIVISETVSKIFSKDPYNFKITSVGLLYISTFIGGCLGSALAGKLSDIVVRLMARRNNGTYEPEFRLVMCIPVLISVSIGMMGFGWSTHVHDMWVVPAIFLGVIGFGCSLGSTTAITYAVDSYKMFASESLVTLNLAKNVIGFAFSFFVPNFLASKGSKTLYVTFGGVHIFLCLWAIPLYIFGKRIRRWTDRKDILRWLYVSNEEPVSDGGETRQEKDGARQEKHNVE